MPPIPFRQAALSLGLAKRQARMARLTAVQVKMRAGAAESEAAAGVRAADLQVTAASGVLEAVAAVAAGTAIGNRQYAISNRQ